MRKALIALGLVAALGISGCSGSHANAEKKTASAAKSKTTSTTAPQFTANTKNTPGTLKNFVGAKADVHDTKCAQNKAWWNAAGKVTNPTKKRARYRIYVSFLKGDTTVGLTQVDVPPLNAHATTDWDAGVKIAGADLRCILRVERAEA